MAGPRLLSKTVPQVAGKVLGKRGLAFGALITEWPSIVGQQMASRTQPEKLIFPRGQREDATLHLRAAGAIALELQHLEPQILERINSFFGYRAVARLRLVAGVLIPPTGPRPPAVKPLSAEQEDRLSTTLASVDDPDLRETLERFGRAVMGRVRS